MQRWCGGFAVFTLVHALGCAKVPPPDFDVEQAEDHWTLSLTRALAPGEELNDCLTVTVNAPMRIAMVQPASDGYALVHHMILWRMDHLGHDGARNCGTSYPDGPMGDGIYATGTGDADMAFPAGTSMHIPAGARLTLNAHFLNATGQQARPTASLRLNLLKDSAPDDQAVALWSVQNYSFHVPPRSQATTSQDCNAPHDATLLLAMAHTHTHGVRMRVERTSGPNAGPLFSFDLSGEQYLQQLQAPVALHAGETVHVSCVLDNPSATQFLTAPDEMCNAFLYVTGWDHTEVCLK